MRPRSSFAGAAIEVSDLGRSIAFHRLWLPMLGFRRVWASPDRVMWSRGYDHFVMRQAKDGVSYGPGALWLAVSAESRAQVDQIYAELRDAKAEILQPPKELDYFAPGYYSVGFRDPDGVPIEVVHRWDELPDLADAEQVSVPGHGVTLGGYLFKPQAGTPPYPALILLHGFPGHAHNMAGLARLASANGYVALALSLRGWLGSEGESDQGLRQPLDVLAAIDWLAKRPLVDRDRLALVGASMGGQVALLAAAHRPPIKAVASFFAATDLARWREANPFVRDYLDDLCGPEGLPVRSPILRVAQIDVPLLLIHGDRDENVPIAQTLAMAEALKTHGKDVETFIVQSGTHFFTEQQNALARPELTVHARVRSRQHPSLDAGLQARPGAAGRHRMDHQHRQPRRVQRQPAAVEALHHPGQGAAAPVGGDPEGDGRRRQRTGRRIRRLSQGIHCRVRRPPQAGRQAALHPAWRAAR
jgi:dienelactone hydrolase